jgi:hypothetical protein
MPTAFNACASSIPIAPAPITTAFCRFLVASFILKSSSSVLKVVTFLRLIPGIFGIKGITPVAIISLSYLITLPSFRVTSLDLKLTFSATPLINSTPLSYL